MSPSSTGGSDWMRKLRTSAGASSGRLAGVARGRNGRHHHPIPRNLRGMTCMCGRRGWGATRRCQRTTTISRLSRTSRLPAPSSRHYSNHYPSGHSTSNSRTAASPRPRWSTSTTQGATSAPGFYSLSRCLPSSSPGLRSGDRCVNWGKWSKLRRPRARSAARQPWLQSCSRSGSFIGERPENGPGRVLPLAPAAVLLARSALW
mmetsp:Transcript_65714/g.156792  ORF Transcript_65714/g.156792 Transcript_65714/m.156792 type:complete len:204 (+) Transcript_65714:221-832(+)